MVLLLRNGSEVEVKLPGRFKVSPQIAGAIKGGDRRGHCEALLTPVAAVSRTRGPVPHRILAALRFISQLSDNI